MELIKPFSDYLTKRTVVVKIMATPASLTSRAQRPMNAWFLFSSKVDGVYQFNIGYKNSRNVFGGYSTSPQNEVNKIPWGSPVQCDFVVKRSKENDVVKMFKFRNAKLESASFDLLIFNMKVGGDMSNFSDKVISLCVEQKEKLLALYLTLSSHSLGFNHHREFIHTEKGVRVDGDGPNLEDILKLGGSMEEYNEFINAMKDSAIEVSKDSNLFEVMAKYRKNGLMKRKLFSDLSNSVEKRSKLAIINESEKVELEDPSGLEKTYMSSFLGSCRIPIENIRIPKELEGNVSESRVDNLICNMKNRFDPSLAVLVVAPENDSQPPILEKGKVGSQQFLVVQKIHTFSAFHKLHKNGEFTQLKGHSKGTILCYVLNTNSSALIHYGNMRSNEENSKLIRKTYPQDFLHVFESLFKSGKSHKDSWKVVERMCKLSRVGLVETASVKKMCSLSTEGFTSLMTMISLMECHKTLDCKTANATNNKFEKLKLTNKIFNSLARCTDRFLLDNVQSVVNKTMSIKSLVENFQEVASIEKVHSVLARFTGYKSKSQLDSEYPGKFSPEIMRKYAGADVEGKLIKDKTLYFLRITTQSHR